MTGVLERVLLPAGCYVYYVRDKHGNPHFQSEASPRLTRGSKASKKGLGVVGPVCNDHRLVEQEYAVIREVVEVYLEEQISGDQENRYRVGGVLQDQRDLLAKLAGSGEHREDTNQERSLVLYEPDAPASGVPNLKSPSPRAALPVKGSRRSLLPISKSLHGHATPRGPFFVKGQKIQDDRGDTLPGYIAPFPSRQASYEAMAVESASNPFLVHGLPLSAPDKDKKERELEPNFDVVRTVQQKYSVLPLGKVVRGGKRGRRVVIPEPNTPLQLVSERSPMEERGRERRKRDHAGMTPLYTTRPDEEIPSCVTPPSTTFREPRYTGQPGWQRPWKPIESRKGPDASRQPRPQFPPPLPTVQGSSHITRMPSRIILNVVLPREDAGEDARMCSRVQTLKITPTGTPRSSNPRPSPASTPPHTPPPTAGTQHEYHLREDQHSETTFMTATLTDADAAADGKHSERQLDKTAIGPTSAAIDPRTAVRGPTAADVGPMAFAHRESSDTLKGRSASENKSNGSPKATDMRNEGNRYGTETDCPVRASQGRERSSSIPTHSRSQRAGVDSSQRQSPTARPQSAVPRLDLGPRMATAESTAHFQELNPLGHKATGTVIAKESSRRATHCELFGPDLCADCETAQHRQQFSARQDILYPQIDVFPRHMVATQKLKEAQKMKENIPKDKDGSHGGGSHRQSYLPGFGIQPKWPYVSVGQLNEVVTDLDLCRRIVEKGHRAKLPSGF